MLTCTWAPTTFAGTSIVRPAGAGATREPPAGRALRDLLSGYARRVEELGISHLLIPQRWWGSGQEIEGSSLDCLAATAYLAACTERLNLITAVHPGFFQPAAIAKWGATLDQLTDGRWAINVTSGWNLEEFRMFGIDALDHDARYRRSAEFVQVLRRAWEEPTTSFSGDFYAVRDLKLEPRPRHPLLVYQGGQSPAAIALAAHHSDWMFLNGGSMDRIEAIVRQVRAACAETGRTVRFALYAAPLCRPTDAQAWAEIDDMLARVDARLAAARRTRVAGAQGMWASDDELSLLDTNEGYASRLIGSPQTILDRIEALRTLGIEMLHLDIRDTLFQEAVLPNLHHL